MLNCRKCILLLLLLVLELNKVEAKSIIFERVEPEENLTESFYADILNTMGKLANDFEFVTVSPDNITFFLWHSGSLKKPTELTKNKSILQDSSNKIILIINGWTSTGTESWIENLAQTYFEIYKNLYFISVDWHKLPNANYFVASTAVQGVGYVSAEILYNLLEKNVSRLNQVHVIGHSLGAHVAGFLGKKIEEMTGNKIDRITGLDAAGPLFTTPALRPATLRLNKSDAKFVDVYHTDINLLGQSPPAGQVDVYWNCGSLIQPGCWEHVSLTKPLGPVECSHRASHVYYAQTIRDSKLYPAGPCSPSNGSAEVIYSGEYVSREVSGIFCGSTVHNGVEKCELDQEEQVKSLIPGIPGIGRIIWICQRLIN